MWRGKRRTGSHSGKDAVSGRDVIEGERGQALAVEKPLNVALPYVCRQGRKEDDCGSGRT